MMLRAGSLRFRISPLGKYVGRRRRYLETPPGVYRALISSYPAINFLGNSHSMSSSSEKGAQLRIISHRVSTVGSRSLDNVYFNSFILLRRNLKS